MLNAAAYNAYNAYNKAEDKACIYSKKKLYRQFLLLHSEKSPKIKK